MHPIKQWLDWRRPLLEELLVLDLVFENKLLLLVTWRAKHVYKVSFPLLKKSYRDAELSVILLLPKHTRQVDIFFGNGWRKIKETILLKKLVLSPELSLQLIHDFKPFRIMSVEDWEPSVLPDSFSIHLGSPKILFPDLQTAFSNLNLRTSQFEYETNQIL